MSSLKISLFPYWCCQGLILQSIFEPYLWWWMFAHMHVLHPMPHMMNCITCAVIHQGLECDRNVSKPRYMGYYCEIIRKCPHYWAQIVECYVSYRFLRRHILPVLHLLPERVGPEPVQIQTATTEVSISPVKIENKEHCIVGTGPLIKNLFLKMRKSISRMEMPANHDRNQITEDGKMQNFLSNFKDN